MKMVRGPIEGPWGATLPVRFVPETTPDDDFEQLALDWTQTYHYPAGAFDTHPGRAWPIKVSLPKVPKQAKAATKRGTKKVVRAAPSRTAYVRPDIVTLISGTSEVVFVGDAKRHARLEKREIAKVIMYRRVTNAAKAAVFVPRTCRISDAVVKYADDNGVLIVDL